MTQPEYAQLAARAKTLELESIFRQAIFLVAAYDVRVFGNRGRVRGRALHGGSVPGTTPFLHTEIINL